MSDAAAFQLTPAESDNHYRLGGRLDFTTAAAALAAISAKLSETDRLVLDLASIESANSAGLALLVECRALASHAGTTVEFLNLPESLLKVAEVCQVQDLLA